MDDDCLIKAVHMREDAMRVLVVDDDAQVRDVLVCGLKYLGVCDVAENGLVAIDLFQRAYLEDKPYGMVTMDCQMPVLDGMEAVSRIRAFEAAQSGVWFRTTICFITGEVHCRQRYEQQHGSDDALYFLGKPFSFIDLGRITKLALNRTRAAQSPIQQLPLIQRVPKKFTDGCPLSRAAGLG
jgi:CheY-like chemotaxis protein